MGDLSARLQVLRERAYVAAPMDDLDHPLHDLVVELARATSEARHLERRAAEAAELERDALDAARERDKAEERLDRLKDVPKAVLTAHLQRLEDAKAVVQSERDQLLLEGGIRALLALQEDLVARIAKEAR